MGEIKLGNVRTAEDRAEMGDGGVHGWNEIGGLPGDQASRVPNVVYAGEIGTLGAALAGFVQFAFACGLALGVLYATVWLLHALWRAT